MHQKNAQIDRLSRAIERQEKILSIVHMLILPAIELLQNLCKERGEGCILSRILGYAADQICELGGSGGEELAEIYQRLQAARDDSNQE